MAARRRSRKSPARHHMGAVKVCKLKGKKLVCRSVKLGSMVLGRKPSRRRRAR